MPALIDSYTTTEPSHLLSADNWYKTEREPLSSSSIIVVISKRTGLNSRIHKLLDEYSTLQDNWDEDDAIAPSDIAISQARFITTLLENHGQPIFHSAPGPNGEVMLDIRNIKRNKSIELIFYPTRSVLVLFSDNEKPVQQNFEIADLPQHLEWLNRK